MTSNKTVAVGVVGTSWWADAMYLPALSNHPNAEVVAVCGRNLERAQQFAKTWNIPHVFTDYAEMMTSGLIEAVVISSSNQTHYPMTMQALESNLHILCEKPLAMNYAQAKEMAERAQEQGGKHLVPFTYRFMPGTRYLKELIDNDYLGTPYHLNMRYYTGYARGGEYMWRFDRSVAGAGVVGDLGTHFLYLADWYYGEIKAVTCQLGHHVPREARPDGQPYEVVDDSAMMLLEFENGAQGSIHVTAVCYEDTPFGQTHHLEFHGSDGTLYHFNDWDKIQRVSGAKVGDGMWTEMPIPDHIWGKARRDTVHNTYRDIFREEDYMIRAWITNIIEGSEPSPNFQDGARIQRYLQAALLSAEESRCVLISEIG